MFDDVFMLWWVFCVIMLVYRLEDVCIRFRYLFRLLVLFWIVLVWELLLFLILMEEWLAVLYIFVVIDILVIFVFIRLFFRWMNL